MFRRLMRELEKKKIGEFVEVRKGINRKIEKKIRSKIKRNKKSRIIGSIILIVEIDGIIKDKILNLMMKEDKRIEIGMVIEKKRISVLNEN